MTTSTSHLPVLEWSVAARTLPGETVCGDAHVVVAREDGMLVAVIDGLGHGEAATDAARRAQAVLSNRAGTPVDVLLQSCHEALRETRGAVMTVVSCQAQAPTLTAAGVGNVETVLCRADPVARPQREHVLLRNGVVGYKLPALPVQTLHYAPGDVLVLATDGVREDFADAVDLAAPLAELVERIMAASWRGGDDALVLACRFASAEGGRS